MKRTNQILHLLSPDAAPSTAPEVDPLAMPSSEINTDFPLLKPDKIYEFIVRDCTLDDAKSADAPPGAKNLVVKLVTAKDEVDVNNSTLGSGFPITKWIPTYAVGRLTIDNVRRSLGEFIKAVLGPSSKVTPRDLLNNPSMFNGRPIKGKVSISKDKTGAYPDSNSVRFVIPE